LPDGLMSVGNGAFFQCALREVVIPDGCRLGGWAFSSCKALVKVTIGWRCSSIGAHAFQSCAALTKVRIRDGLMSIGGSAFCFCHVLSVVVLPPSVQSIGEHGFGQCRSLLTIAVPNCCRLHVDAFWGCSPRVTRF
jgi:hypothetical protein